METNVPIDVGSGFTEGMSLADELRVVNANLIEGRPAMGAQVLEAAAASDPRIARALQAFDRDPTAGQVFAEVRDKLAKDPESGYQGLDTSVVPVPPVQPGPDDADPEAPKD